MNGVVNLSVLDGWWYEGYREGAGWALTEKRTFQNQEQQDQLDAATIYSLLENEILPLYYARNSKGYSEGWIRTVKNSIAQIAPHYTMKRQLDDYYDRFYQKEGARGAKMAANNYQLAKELAAWKEKVADNWDSVEVREVNIPTVLSEMPQIGNSYPVTVTIDGKAIADSIGLDLVVTKNDGQANNYRAVEMEVVKREGTLVTFCVNYNIKHSGAFKFGFRMFPKNEELPHRMDFAYTRWF